MDTKKLRQKILDLAIHGKLVPQDPNDEPASVLLERIRKEKEQLIKEGKIKAPKKSKTAGDTSHYPKEMPFEVPEGWVLSTVLEVFQINPKNYEDDSTEAGFVPMANISDGFEDKYSYEVKPWKSIKSGFTHFRNGDIAVAKISPCLENRKSFVVRGLPQEVGAGTTELFIFRSGQIIPEYGLLFFKSEFFISNCVGTFNGVVGQQRVARNIIEEMPFPIPPIAEQAKIIQSVNSIFSMISEVENNQSALKSSAEKSKALILDLAIHGKLVPQDPSEEPAIELLKRINPAFQPSHNLHYEERMPNGWCIAPLSSFCTTVNGLWKGNKEPLVNVGVIRNANFTKDFDLDYSKIEYIDVEKKAFERRNLEDGDIIVEKSGGSDNFPVGRSILYNGDSKKFSFSNFTMSLRILDKSLIRPKYLFFVLQHKYRRGDMKQMQTQTTGLHNLLTDTFLSALIPIPPVNEQDRIVLAVERMFRTVDVIRNLVKDCE